MTSFDDLFKDIETTSQPRTFEKEKQVHESNVSLFKNKDDISACMTEIQEIINQTDDLFNELGDGKINKNLTIPRRNEIIEQLSTYHERIDILHNQISSYFGKDVIRTKGLKVSSSTNANVFDSLLGDETSKLTSDDLIFRRRSN